MVVVFKSKSVFIFGLLFGGFEIGVAFGMEAGLVL